MEAPSSLSYAPTSVELQKFETLHVAVRTAIEQFTGTSASERTLFAQLQKLESWIHGRAKAAFRGHGSEGREDNESAITRALGEECTITGLLEEANRRCQKLFEQAGSVEELCDNAEIFHRSVHGVLIPTKRASGPHRGEGTEVVRRIVEPRLATLLSGLRARGITSDDLIVTTGTLKRGMIREQPYVLVSIPRLGREVLVCDEIGEATFVSNRLLGIRVYLKHKKDELVDTYGLLRVVSRELAAWSGRVVSALLDGVSPTTPHVNVRTIAEVQQAALQKYTPKQWAAMTQPEKGKVELCGKKLISLGTLLSIEGNPFSRREMHLRLGLKIFGEANRTLNEALRWELATPEEWKREIRKWWTSQQWMDMPDELRRSLTLHGKAKQGMANAIGYEGNPMNKAGHCAK